MLAAAVAFYSLLSIAPLVVVAVTVASLVFEREQVRAAVLRQLGGVANPTSRRVLVRLLDAAEHSGGRVAAVIALVMLAWAASRLFLQLQEALNVIWGVRVAAASTREIDPPHRGQAR